MEEKREVKKEEIVLPLLENFKKINNANINTLKTVENEELILEESEIIKNNVLAMCEIANTLNNIFGMY